MRERKKRFFYFLFVYVQYMCLFERDGEMEGRGEGHMAMKPPQRFGKAGFEVELRTHSSDFHMNELWGQHGQMLFGHHTTPMIPPVSVVLKVFTMGWLHIIIGNVPHKWLRKPRDRPCTILSRRTPIFLSELLSPKCTKASQERTHKTVTLRWMPFCCKLKLILVDIIP